MAKIDDILLARRQKDLERYVDDYQMRLEVMTMKHLRDLSKTWQSTATRLQAKIKALYDEADAATNLKKATALKYKAERLSALQEQLVADIKVAALKQQPYYTGILKNQFEDSYYYTAFRLEQAGRIAAMVPILTPAMVLGVLANPWLSDGANYAQRIGANMSYFASNIKKSVETAVNEGWGWNETAQEIRRRTQEGYFNAVRLARTELTRAAAQGASYSYMQNSDVLDGKRWNATKDSRTAPKDARNDGKLYDLDYDTMENPGIPGQRIPNHPHCRCLWSPVLSALGVQTKERIARGSGNTPSSWGKNYYTKAATYADYAKERGLPDIDERVKRDNPNKYLRPGETIADLSKQVIRWTSAGNTITIAKPDWEDIKQNPDTGTIKEKQKAVKVVKTGHMLPVDYFEGAKVKIDDQIQIMIQKLKETTGVDHSTEELTKLRKSMDMYTGRNYKAIRKAQITGEGTDDIIQVGKDIDKFIEISPKWDNSVGLLRGMRVPASNKQFFESLEKGTTLDMQGTSSWTSSGRTARDFTDKGAKSSTPVMFHLDKTNKGTSVQYLSKHPYEKEVLLPSNANFKIKEVVRNKSGSYDVYLEELK